MTKMDPQELAALQKLDQQTISGVVATFTPVLLRAALGLGFPESEAEELVQDTLVGFFKNAPSYKGESSLKTFLFSILYHKVSDRRHQVYREETVDPLEEGFEARFNARGAWISPPKGPEDEALAHELAEWIARCSEHLSVKEKMVFQLKDVQDEETGDICKILSITVTNLGVLLYRARTKLRECLERKWIKNG